MKQLEQGYSLKTWERLTCFNYSFPYFSVPSDSVDKESACNTGDLGLIHGSGRSPGKGNGNSLQYSCLGNPKERGAWRAIVHGILKSWTQLSDYTINPLLQLHLFPSFYFIQTVCELVMNLAKTQLPIHIWATFSGSGPPDFLVWRILVGTSGVLSHPKQQGIVVLKTSSILLYKQIVICLKIRGIVGCHQDIQHILQNSTKCGPCGFIRYSAPATSAVSFKAFSAPAGQQHVCINCRAAILCLALPAVGFRDCHLRKPVSCKVEVKAKHSYRLLSLYW